MIPSDEATNPVGESRAYTVTETVADTDHTIALFPAENVSVDGNGVFTFVDAADDGDADGQGDTPASITVVNGESTDQTAVQTAQPVNGEITFTINSSATDSVILVVFFDAPEGDPAVSDGELNVDADGEPTEVFGIGGQKNWFDEASSGTSVAPATVEFVNTVENFFDADGQRYFYGAGDVFRLVDDGVATCDASDNVSQGVFEQNLSRQDILNTGTVYFSTTTTPTGDSIFCLQDAAPTAPTATGATAQSDSSTEVTFTGDPTDTVSFNIYRSTETTPVFADGDFAVVATVDAEAGETTYEHLDTGLAADTTYTYVVTAVADGDESAPSNAVSATTLEAGQTINAQSQDATVTNDAGVGAFNEQGTVSNGDEWQVLFDQPLEALDNNGTEAIRVVGANANVFDAVCGAGGNATCSLNLSTVERGTETYAAGEVLTVTINVTPTTDVTYPAEITQVTGFTSGAGTWVLVESPDTTLEVDETSAVTPVAPAMASAVADTAGNTVTVTYTESVDCTDDVRRQVR